MWFLRERRRPRPKPIHAHIYEQTQLYSNHGGYSILLYLIRRRKKPATDRRNDVVDNVNCILRHSLIG